MLRYAFFAVFWMVIGAVSGALPYWMDAEKRVRLFVSTQAVVDTKTIFNVHEIMVTSNALTAVDRFRLLAMMEDKTRNHVLFKPYRKHIEKIMAQVGVNQEKLEKIVGDVSSVKSTPENIKSAPTNTHLSIIREVAGRVYEQIGYELAKPENGKIPLGDALRVSMPDGFKQNSLVDKAIVDLKYPSGVSVKDRPFQWDMKAK